MEGHDFFISKNFFFDAFGSLCSPKDITDLRALWVEEERQAEVRAAKEAERARLAAEQARERRALEEQRQRFLSIKEFIDLCLKASADPLPASVYVTPPVPTNEDWQLIRRWMRKEGIAEQESEKRRMLSARLAEKAVLSFFRAQGCIVHDISITQLSESTSPEWPYCDINVDGVPIDVKNVRRSKKNPDRYVHHCVPRFKEARTLEAVQVAGVLSHLLLAEEMLSQGKTVLFLGLTNTQEHERD